MEVISFGHSSVWDGTKIIKMPFWDDLVKEFGKITPVTYRKLKESKGRKEKRYIEKELEEYLENHFSKTVELSNLRSIYKFFKNRKDCIVFISFPETLPSIPVYFILTTLNIKYIQIKIKGGIFFSNKDLILKSLNKNYMKNLIYGVFFRLFMKANIINKYKFLLTAGTYRLEKLKQSGLYQEVVSVNAFGYDEFLRNKKNPSEEYIVFLDSDMPYHKDEIKYGLEPIDRELYFTLINNFLDKLSAITGKKVIICTHPAYDMSKAAVDYPRREVVQKRTEEFILKSSLIVFDTTSAIYYGIYYKKPIIQLTSGSFNSYYQMVQESYYKEFAFLQFNIDSYTTKDIEEILKSPKRFIDKNKMNKIIAYPEVDSSKIIVEKMRQLA